MSTQPLTPVERAALAAMMSNPSPNNCWCDWVAGDPPCDECSRAARAVVAAVEQPIAIAALESAAAALDELAAANARAGRGTAEGPWIAAGVQGAALHVRNLIRARQSLSRPTSEEH